jgi:hypothetical protein
MNRASLGLAATLALAATSASASLRQFSYDPANAATREAAGGVTFLINQGMFGSRVLKMRATEAKASADLSRANPDTLGPGGLGRALGPAAPERDLYAIADRADGPALLAALCPGSRRGWIALTGVRYGSDLQAVIIGDDPAGRGAHRCRTLDFTFHGEWRLPPGSSPALEAASPPDFPN